RGDLHASIRVLSLLKVFFPDRIWLPRLAHGGGRFRLGLLALPANVEVVIHRLAARGAFPHAISLTGVAVTRYLALPRDRRAWLAVPAGSAPSGPWPAAKRKRPANLR